MAAAVTPCLFEYSITACLKRMVCVILFMANRVTPAFGFCLDNSTLTQVTPIRYLFLCFVTHHCNTYNKNLLIFTECRFVKDVLQIEEGE